MSNIGSESFSGTGVQSLHLFNTNFAKVTGFTATAYVSTDGVCYVTNGPSDAYYLHLSDPPSADYSVSCDLIVNTILTNNYAAVLFRVSSTASTFYRFSLVSSTGVVQLLKFVAGAQTSLATTTISVSAGTTYRLEIVGIGNQLFGYVNGSLAFDPITDNSISDAGHPGILLRNSGTTSSTTGITLDNLSWDTIETGAVTHVTTGALTAGAATMGGTSAHIATHVTSGALVAGAATLDGTAAREGSATTHVTTGALVAGAATMAGTSSHAASGSFVSDVLGNNTSSIWASTAVVWEWREGTGIGVAPTSVTYGTGTTSSLGVLTCTGLPTGAGELLIATTDYTGVAYQRGTVA